MVINVSKKSHVKWNDEMINEALSLGGDKNVTNSINASMQDVTNAINYCNINYCNQNTSQVCNFDPIKVPLPREEVNEESSIFEKILLWLEDRVNELNDLLSMILE